MVKKYKKQYTTKDRLDMSKGGRVQARRGGRPQLSKNVRKDEQQMKMSPVAKKPATPKKKPVQAKKPIAKKPIAQKSIAQKSIAQKPFTPKRNLLNKLNNLHSNLYRLKVQKVYRVLDKLVNQWSI
jgi:hypothetical protein